MGKERQNVEWKVSWRDDYLKWICGFANANGGTLVNGRDDHGFVKHVEEAKALLEDLPNKIKDVLGILADVNLLEEAGDEYIEIVVEHHPSPISLRGRYYYRSGSTLQELKGASLDKFLLERQGKKWDGFPMPNITQADLKSESFEFFRRKAERSNRLDREDLEGSYPELLDSLHLYDEDGQQLKRAAILLFHPKPERYFPGAFVKIGFFESDDDLKYHDEVRGGIIEQAERVLELLSTKYDKAAISYVNGARIEKTTFPEEAVREAVMNAIAHKDYSSGVPIQIRVYENRMSIWNVGQLPENWTVERLSRQHPSKPHNPDIANTLFRAGYIESWGRGTIKMINACRDHKIAPPVFTPVVPDFQVEFINYTEQGLKAVGLKEELIKIVLHIQEYEAITNSVVQELCGVSKATASRYLKMLDESDFVVKRGSTGIGTTYYLKGSLRAHNT